MRTLTASLTLALLAALATPAWAANLTLENRSNRSLPLEIPGVMNPNLSPRSTSGVTLEPGQKVYFRHRGKRELLLEIRNEKDGDVIVVNEVLARRIAEIDAQAAAGR
jgi:hypothetical protein